MTNSDLKKISFAAVGDLLLTNNPDGSPGRGLEALSEDLRRFFKSCDIVFANLECTLPGPELVPTEPRVVSTEKQILSIKDSGINVVTIGNNHIFDCGDQGFEYLQDVLLALEIPFCGAGKNIDRAFNPAIIERNGIRVAFIGVVDPSSGQHRFATETMSGAAPMAVEKICSTIQELRETINHVIVTPHWGEERFRIPSPGQVEQARAFVNAGASMVLGHHPHVLQGLEMYRGKPIAYSLGNFLGNEVHFSNGDKITWSRFEKTGCIVTGELNENGVSNVEQIPVFDNGKTVGFEAPARGKRYLDKVNALLSRGVTPERYHRESFRVKKVKPILNQLHWSNLKRMRPGKIKKAFQLVFSKN